MRKTGFFSLLAILLTFSLIGCDDKTNDEDNNCTVTFDLEGGNINGITTSVEIKVKSGEKIVNIPNPQKTDNDFGGWFTQKNGAGTQFTSSTSVTSNLTVYAKWALKITSVFEGSWYNADSKKTWTFTGNNFLVTFSSDNNVKGTFTYTETVLTLTVTHIWYETEWLTEWDPEDLPPNPMIIEYTISNNILTLVEDHQGPFTKQ